MGDEHGIRMVGVCGAGTMGAGIAQVCATSGFTVLLYDAFPEVLPRALSRIQQDTERLVQRGRLKAEDRKRALESLRTAHHPEALADCHLIVEAAFEDLAIKKELFGRLGAVAPQAVLATNTSSLSVAELAGAASQPERVAGLHFFNPAPVMALVEVVRAPQTDPQVVDRLVAFARALGKTPIVARDSPGFVVNRVNRPFYMEGLRLAAEGLADFQTVDRVAREAGGFRMGPFELMDLVGIDVGYAVSQSFHQAFFGEPRFRPHPLQREMVLSGRLGRKTGRGFYRYDEPVSQPPPLPLPSAQPGPYAVAGDTRLAHELAGRLRQRGFEVLHLSRPPDRPLAVAAAFEAEVEDRHRKREFVVGLDQHLPEDAVLLVACTNANCAECATWGSRPGRVAGYATLPPLEDRGLLEWTAHELTTVDPLPYLAALGLPLMRVGDAPGGVFPRLLAVLVNEAAFAVAEGVASPQHVDLGMRLGLNHPHGPFAWAERVGVQALAGVLDALRDYYGEERYRLAPVLRRARWLGRWPHGEPGRDADGTADRVPGPVGLLRGGGPADGRPALRP
ncbi:MAG: 3-hydroxybutyryl-CoA dehydrogenase [candidate division GAL15 bacterium]